ncbi:tyrosyl-DNA phosphodiesterase 2-like [Diretmus argenteus]
MEKVLDVEVSPERETGPKAKRKKSEGNAPQGCIDLTEDSPTCSNQQQQQTTTTDKLSVISWNVDGLDTDNLANRAKGLCSVLVSYKPEVVLLQELIPPYIRNLKKWAVHKAYTVIEGGKGDYFTGMLLKNSRVTLLESEIVIYPTTKMTRNLLVAKVSFKGQELWLMTSHYESCKENGKERMKQLRVVMKRMREAPDNINVLFGGDTNLRDTEVAKVGLPSGVLDLWERLGKQEQCRYTWDTKVNTNKNIPQICRFRFDRVYLRPATREGVPHLAPDHMALVGLQKLHCGLYPSDHWGIFCSFSAE